MANMSEFDHDGGMNLVYNSGNTTISFEYGTVKISCATPEEEVVKKDGKVITEVALTRNQIKDIIDMYARLYEPRIQGWSN